jgi:hypothetical protein
MHTRRPTAASRTCYPPPSSSPHGNRMYSVLVDLLPRSRSGAFPRATSLNSTSQRCSRPVQKFARRHSFLLIVLRRCRIYRYHLMTFRKCLNKQTIPERPANDMYLRLAPRRRRRIGVLRSSAMDTTYGFYDIGSDGHFDSLYSKRAVYD